MGMYDPDQAVILYDSADNPIDVSEQNGVFRLRVAVAGREPVSSVATSRTAASATAVTLKASNTSRTALSIQNDSNKDLYVLLGSGTPSTTNYSVMLERRGGYYEMPFLYTGEVKGIWDGGSPSGGAQVVEAAS